MKHENLTVTGKIVKVIDDQRYLLSITKQDDDTWTDDIYLSLDSGTNCTLSIEDVITVYGTSEGFLEYTPIHGDYKKIPELRAKVISNSDPSD